MAFTGAGLEVVEVVWVWLASWLLPLVCPRPDAVGTCSTYSDDAGVCCVVGVEVVGVDVVGVDVVGVEVVDVVWVELAVAGGAAVVVPV